MASTAQYSYSEILIRSLPNGPSKDSAVTIEKKQDIRILISEILKIPNDPRNWVVQDEIPEQNLYLIHYSQTADLNVYGNLRGLIVDTELKSIVCRGRCYTPIVTSDHLVLNQQNQLVLVDENKQVHTISKFSIERGYEATTLNVWKHNGKVYHSTNKTIDASKSHWGKSKTFLQIYRELGGPADEELFNPGLTHSRFVHEFLIVHPDLLNVTKLPIGEGFIVYINAKVMWDLENPNFQTVVNKIFDFEPKGVKGSPDLLMNSKTPFIHTPTQITLEQANDHLKYGFYREQDLSKIDPRLTPGEFIIVYSFDAAGKIEKIVKVQSTAYAWRSGVRNQNPNLKQRLFMLVNDSYKEKTDHPEESYDRFLAKYPLIAPKELSLVMDILSKGPIIIFPQDKDYTKDKYPDMIQKTEQKFYNIFLCFFMAVPLNFQEYVLNLYNEFINDRNEVMEWLKELSKINYDTVSDPLFYRANNIITEARRQASYTMKNPTQYSQGHSFYYIFSKNIYSFIMRERGNTLYQLVKLMHKYREEEKNKSPDDGVLHNTLAEDGSLGLKKEKRVENVERTERKSFSRSGSAGSTNSASTNSASANSTSANLQTPKPQTNGGYWKQKFHHSHNSAFSQTQSSATPQSPNPPNQTFHHSNVNHSPNHSPGQKFHTPKRQQGQTGVIGQKGDSIYSKISIAPRKGPRNFEYQKTGKNLQREFGEVKIMKRNNDSETIMNELVE